MQDSIYIFFTFNKLNVKNVIKNELSAGDNCNAEDFYKLYVACVCLREAQL